MPDYIAAFSDKDSARKAQASLGGELLSYRETWTKLGGGSAAKN
jgi:hypothetical protein